MRAIPGARPENRTALFAEACADLFGQPMCREAIRMSPVARPEQRALMIAVACQHAYCPELSEPLPTLCEREPNELTPHEISSNWAPFLEGMLARELGERPVEDLAERLSGLFALLLFEPVTIEVEPPQPAPSPRSPTLVVRLTINGNEYRIEAELPGEVFGPWDLPLRPDQGDFSGLLEAAMRACNGCAAEIHVEPSIDYELVIHLMDALREGGVEEITLATID